MKSPKAIYALVFSLILSMSSCIEMTMIEEQAELDITILGLLSNNEREGIKVILYEHEEDAEEGNDNSIGYTVSNENGECGFWDIDPNQRYWLRIEQVLMYKVVETSILNPGNNDMIIKVL